MLRWQQPSVRKRYKVYLQIISFCALWHCVVLVWAFFGYKDPHSHVTFVLDYTLLGSDTEIMLIPTIDPKLLAQKSSGKTVHKKNNDAAQTNDSVKKIIKTELISKKQTVVAAPEKKEIVPTHVASKMSAIVTKDTVKKEPEKGVATAQKVVDVVKPEKKEQKNIPIKSVAEVKQSSEKNNIKKLLDSKSIDQADRVAPKNEIQNGEGPIAVYATPSQVEGYRQAHMLQEELSRTWKLPAGMKEGTECQITIKLNWNNAIQKITVDRSSGVLVFDVAARSALYSMKMPEWTKGKTITLSFKR